LSIQNEDGSFYRSYISGRFYRMTSKSNHTGPSIRFLVQSSCPRDASTGRRDQSRQWLLPQFTWIWRTRRHLRQYGYQDKERGSTHCWLPALYDLTGRAWLEAAVGAEITARRGPTPWTYPYARRCCASVYKYSITRQSIITIAAARTFTWRFAPNYYRLYLITGDVHYLDFAEFIDKTPASPTMWTAPVGTAYAWHRPLSGNFTTQTFRSHYHCCLVHLRRDRNHLQASESFVVYESPTRRNEL
jgi:hypothetical protein